MARLVIPAALLVVLAVFGLQCRRSASSSPNILTGKLIIADGCSQFAVQIIDGSFNPSQVVASWKNPDDDSVYTNVFRLTAVKGACAISYYGVSKGDIFQFQIDPDPQNQTCFVCDVLVAISLPSVSDAIMNVKKISNN